MIASQAAEAGTPLAAAAADSGRVITAVEEDMETVIITTSPEAITGTETGIKRFGKLNSVNY